MNIADYTCMKCDYIWQEEVKGPTECPSCGSIYVMWTNYKELFEKRFSVKDETCEHPNLIMSEGCEMCPDCGWSACG